MKNLLFLMLASCCVFVFGDQACRELSESDKKFTMSSFPREFTVDIEAVMKETKTVKKMSLIYSANNNMIRLTSKDNTGTTDLFFQFTENEILAFDFQPNKRGVCKVYQDLPASADNFLLGSVNGLKKIPVPLAALHFSGLSGFSSNKIFQNKVGPGKSRGQKTTVYNSCQKWVSAHNNIVLNVTHQFATDDMQYSNKRFINKKYTIPNLLSMHINGQGKYGDQLNTNVDHTYNLYNFKEHFSIDYFQMETPEGIQCVGRKDSKPMPKPSPYVHATVEVIDTSKQSYLVTEQIYDYNDNYFLLATPNSPPNYDKNGKIYTLADFKTGTSYRFAQDSGRCIQGNTSVVEGLPYVSTDKAKAMLRGPSAYYLQNNKDFSYLGKKVKRGMLTDTWVLDTNEDPDSPNEVIQLSFAPKVKSWNDGTPDYQKNKYGIPVQMMVWENQTSTQPQIINWYHVDFHDVRPASLDLSSCFEHSVFIQFVCPNAAGQVKQYDSNVFKTQTAKQIAKMTDTRWTQVNRVKMFYRGNDVVVDFLLSGNSDMSGPAWNLMGLLGNITLTAYESDGTRSWEDHVHVHSVNFVPVQVIESQKLKIPGTIYTKGKTGYSNGSMAGLGVAMVLVGLLGGAGAGFAHLKFF